MKKKIKYFLIILTGIFLEFFRDYCFININLQIEYLENIANNLAVFNYTDSNVFIILKSMSIKSINNLKWILSLLFITCYFLIGLGFSSLFFNSKTHKKFLKIFSCGGILIIFFSLFILVFGKLFSLENQMNFYYVSLELSHFVQSSLYPISFLLIFYANNKLKISS
ncbi:hypothetical protein OA958_00085 [Bacteroidota bacterium]|nr:hypothetical protein [Bacteroidota bacterium]